MATFEQHIAQAKKNLSFLGKINDSCNDFWDWQVTTCFYVAVHLANAHISNKAGMHFRTHSDVKYALNPTVQLSLSKFDENEFNAYVKLMNLSRRARYLCHDSPTNLDARIGHFTHDVHLNKAIKNLDKLLTYMENEYKISFDKSPIKCLSLTVSTNYFVPNN